MRKTTEVNKIISDDNLLEVLIKFDEGNKVSACRMFQYYTQERVRMPVTEVMKLLQELHKEWSE